LLLADAETRLSVIGIIAIPGMMSGAILGLGSSVQQASKLQMPVVITFMISSATAMASTFETIAVIVVAVDGEHRIRDDRINGGVQALWRGRDAAAKEIVVLLRRLLSFNTKSRV
jgi:hypothetical protein